jgi:fructose 1,6-bisphosphate aldolase/phosphatase
MKVSQKAEDIRRQGFAGAAMLPMTELEYTGVMDTLNKLEKRFVIKK